MRDSTILVGLSIAAILVGGYLIFYSQTTTSASATATNESVVTQVPFMKLADGQHAKIPQRVNYMLENKSQLDSLWRSVGASSTEPTVDFEANNVLAIFAGAEPNAGYGVAVSGIEDKSGIRTVNILFQRPGAGCAPAQVVTHPFELVAVPKSTGQMQLTHIYATSTVSCQ